MEYLKKLEIVRDFMCELYNASTDPKEQQLYMDLESAYYIRYKRKAPLLPLSKPTTTKPYINCYGQVVPPPPEYAPPAVPEEEVKVLENPPVKTWGDCVRERRKYKKQIDAEPEKYTWGGPPVTEEEWKALENPPAKTWGDCVREKREYEKWFRDTYEKPKKQPEPEPEEILPRRMELSDFMKIMRKETKYTMNLCNDLISDYEDAEEENPDLDELDIRGHFNNKDIDNIMDGLFDIDTFVSKLKAHDFMELGYYLREIKEYLEDKHDEI